MNEMFLLGMPGGAEMIVLLVVVLLLFGGTRLPQLAKGLGQSVKEFKRGVALGADACETEESARSLPAAGSAGVRAEGIARDGYVAVGRG